MTERIVVGVDGSRNAAVALAWAIEGAAGAAVEAVAAWQTPVVPAPFGIGDVVLDLDEVQAATERDVHDTIAAARAMAAERTGDVEVSGRVVAGPIGPTLCDEAAGARVLVVGQRGSGGFAGLHLGSVSEYCLHHCETPVAIIPEGAPLTSTRVVVGVDGGDDSIDALGWGADEAERRGLPLVALIAWSWMGQPVGRDELKRPGWTAEQAATVVEHAIERAGVDGQVETVVENALAAPALVEASDQGALVVLGAVGHGGIRGRLAGSVSRQVAHHATGPMIIVR